VERTITPVRLNPPELDVVASSVVEPPPSELDPGPVLLSVVVVDEMVGELSPDDDVSDDDVSDVDVSDDDVSDVDVSDVDVSDVDVSDVDVSDVDVSVSDVSVSDVDGIMDEDDVSVVVGCGDGSNHDKPFKRRNISYSERVAPSNLRVPFPWH